MVGSVNFATTMVKINQSFSFNAFALTTLSILDIALIKFPPCQKFNLGPNLNTIEFGERNNQELVGQMFEISGWGKIEGGQLAPQLRVATMTFVTPNLPLDNHPPNAENILEAMQLGSISNCFGDSGGEAVTKNNAVSLQFSSDFIFIT